MKLKKNYSASKKILIVSSSREEAITQWAIQRQQSKGAPLSLMHNGRQIDWLILSDLLQGLQIHDELNQDSVSIRWYSKNSIKYSNDSHVLLNRITYIDNKLFESYCIADREYAKREFEAYLGFALNSFDKVQAIAINGLCERILSLPQQWNLVKKKLGLAVPDFFWGFKQKKAINVTFSIEKKIHSSIYDYLNWTVQQNTADNLETINPFVTPIKSSEFYFEKPEGEPIFILSIGEKILISPDDKISFQQQEKIKKCVTKVRKLFNYFIFELLVFLTKDALVFGCVNIDLLHTKNHPDFFLFLDKYLINEYYRCLP
ncbi:MAG: hypothetical protein H2069_04530 [Legionella sp.]|nr:hypothetical protein [Legionella sp.]